VSTICFGSASGTADLHGAEHARLWHLVKDIATGILAVRRPGGGRERMEELTGTAAPEDFGAFQEWATLMEYRFTSHAAEGITWRGQPLNMPAFVANTAIATGSDPVRLSVRIIEQCDDHCWVEGPDRAWLATIIARGLDAGVFRGRILNYGDGPLFRPAGWEDVSALLLSRADEPVVLSHAGSGQFASYPPAGWRPGRDGDGDAGQEWHEMEKAGQWRAAMDALRAQRPWQRLDPAAWHDYRFVHGLSVLDLLADDYAARLDKAVTGTGATEGQ